MSICTLVGIIKFKEGKTLSGHDLKCPLDAIGMPTVKGAVTGAYGIKSARLLSGLLLEYGAIDPFVEKRDVCECRFDVPRGDNDSRLYLAEIPDNKMVNMLRLRKDALDYINEQWVTLLPSHAPVDEYKFPRVPTTLPNLITKLRSIALPNANFIIYPIKVGEEILAMGSFFDKELVSSIQITL